MRDTLWGTAADCNGRTVRLSRVVSCAAGGLRELRAEFASLGPKTTRAYSSHNSQKASWRLVRKGVENLEQECARLHPDAACCCASVLARRVALRWCALSLLRVLCSCLHSAARTLHHSTHDRLRLAVLSSCAVVCCHRADTALADRVCARPQARRTVSHAARRSTARACPLALRRRLSDCLPTTDFILPSSSDARELTHAARVSASSARPQARRTA